MTLAVILTAAGAAAAGGQRASTALQPPWVAKTSSALVRQWFPGKVEPTSVRFHYGVKHSTVTVRFDRTVTCNCPAPPGASVSGRRAVFTLDTLSRRMLTFQVYPR